MQSGVVSVPISPPNESWHLLLRRVGLLLALIFCVGPSTSFGQDLPTVSTPSISVSTPTVPTPTFSIGGSITVTADFYNYVADPDSAQKGRRPPELYRVLFAPTFNFGEDISLPFNIALTTPETNTTTPSVKKPTLPQFFENPANAFGFSSITPKIGWAQFYVGSHTPVYSPLSVGDQQIFGAGIDFKPGNFEIASSFGTAQRAIEPDTAKKIPGAYRRDMYIARLGFGKPENSVFGVNVAYAKDALGSIQNNIVSINPAHPASTDSSVIIPADTLRLRAEEGFVASTDMKIAFSESTSFSAEAAISSFSRDQTSPEKAIAGNPLAFAMTTRTSTRADFAGNATLQIQQKAWGIKLSGLYMGAGFQPIGYSFVQNDRLEVSVAPNFHLFENKFSLDGSIGERINNLSQTKGETSTQLIGAANVNAEISDAFSISAKYSNFGVRNDQTIDTLKIENVSQSLSIDPVLTLSGSTATHIITASVGIDQYKDFNVVSGASSSNDTRSILGSYTLVLNRAPLTVNLLGTYLENALSTGTLIIRSAGATVGYSFFSGALSPSFSLTASGNNVGGAPVDDQLFYKFSLRIKPVKLIELNGSIGNNAYQYGDPRRQGRSFRETLIRLALTTKF